MKKGKVYEYEEKAKNSEMDSRYHGYIFDGDTDGGVRISDAGDGTGSR